MTKSLLHGGERHKKSAIQYGVTRTIREVGPGTMAVQERTTTSLLGKPWGAKGREKYKEKYTRKQAQHCFHHPIPQSFLYSLFVACLMEDFFF